MVAEHEEHAERRFEPAERRQQLTDVGAVEVDEIASAGDEIGLLCREALDDLERLVDRQQLAKMEVAHVADPESVELGRPPVRGHLRLADHHALVEVATGDPPPADPVWSHREQEVPDTRPPVPRHAVLVIIARSSGRAPADDPGHGGES